MRRAAIALLLALLALPAAAGVSDRAGFWTWLWPQQGFPFDAYVEKLSTEGHTWTAGTCFRDPQRTVPECRTQAWADLLAHRVRQLNEAGIGPVIIYAFNRWEDPSCRGSACWRGRTAAQLTPAEVDWVRRLTLATRGLDILWSPVLEPAQEQRQWVEAIRRELRARDGRPIANNLIPGMAGFNYYEETAKSGGRWQFKNGDHDQRFLREKRPSAQVALIGRYAPRVGVLMVTKMRLGGRDWCLPGWRGQNGNGQCDVADWDNEEAWAAMGRAAGGEPVPSPIPTPRVDRLAALAKAIRHLNYFNSAWPAPFDQLPAEQQAECLKRTAAVEARRRELGDG